MTMEQRLDRLETQNRRLRLGLAFAVVIGTAGLIMGLAGQGTIPDVVRARAFHVVSKKGVALVKVGVCDGPMELDGWVTTFNYEGKLRTRLGGIAAGSVKTYRSNGQPSVFLDASMHYKTETTQGRVTTFDSSGQKLVQLGATEGGDGVVGTLNGKGHDLVTLGVSKEGEGMVAVYDPTGRHRRGVLMPEP